VSLPYSHRENLPPAFDELNLSAVDTGSAVHDASLRARLRSLQL
jgi:hypothetical protein